MHQVGFGAWNWVAVIGYLVIMLIERTLLKGLVKIRIVSLRQVVVCLRGPFSIYATTLSAITFMSHQKRHF